MALKLGDLSKVPPRQKVLLAVLFCGLVVTGYYYLYYREASQRIGAMETQLAAFRARSGSSRRSPETCVPSRTRFAGSRPSCRSCSSNFRIRRRFPPCEKRFRPREGIGTRIPSLRPVRRDQEGFLRRDPRVDLRQRRLSQLRPLYGQGGALSQDREPVQHHLFLSKTGRGQPRPGDRQLHGHDLPLPRTAGRHRSRGGDKGKKQ